VHVELILPALILLALANGAPVVAKDLFAGAAAWPIDLGRTFVDGQPVLGKSKTFRGLAVAVAVSACAAPLMGLSWRVGAAIAAASMAIDCQNTYRQGVMRLEGVEAALDEATKLLELARGAGTPIFHIQHDAGAGTPYDIRSEIGAIADPVAPRSG
jgi:hypothetical protein